MEGIGQIVKVFLAWVLFFVVPNCLGQRLRDIHSGEKLQLSLRPK